jgi:hypothetical protein
MSIYIFTGPTLSREAVRAEVDAVCMPPVSQGDVYRVGIKRPRAIGIIDGYFERVPAVWHKEILWAMSQGIHVYGSASMGALRAAELCPFGMEGVGEIFEAYRDGALEDDDEVAVAHGAAEAGYRCLSEAMINIRRTLEAAEAAAVIGAETRRGLERIAKRLFYPERHYPRILQEGAAAGLAAAELGALRQWLPAGQVNQKQRDALQMLRLMREQLAGEPGPKQVSYGMAHTASWENLMTLAGSAGPGAEGDSEMLTTAVLVDELRLKGPDYVSAFHGAMLRHLALAAAQRDRDPLDAESLGRAAAEFRRARGLTSAEDVDAWLDQHHVSRERLEELVREEALLRRVVSRLQWQAVQRLPDYLRLSGEYAELITRARSKQETLAARGLENPGLDDAGLSAEALYEWYFGTLGLPVPGSIGRYARSAGFAAPDALMRAVVREYCYLRATK